MLKNNYFISKKIFFLFFISIIVLTILFIISVCTGSVKGAYNFFLDFLTFKNNNSDQLIRLIILKIRLPRAITTAIVGASLSVSGLVFQNLLNNPLAEPYILGISGSSAIGAIIGIFLGAEYIMVSFFSFLGSMFALCFILNSFFTKEAFLKKEKILLEGVMINTFASAFIMFFISISNNDKLQNIIYWLMGDFSTATAQKTFWLLSVSIPLIIIIFFMSFYMNLLLTGQQMAHTAGINVKRISIILCISASLLVSSTVSQCGLIGFVGLLIPHLLRITFGVDNRVLVLFCITVGASFMIFCDILSRIIPNQGEIPIGVITAIIGAPLFIFLLKRKR